MQSTRVACAYVNNSQLFRSVLHQSQNLVIKPLLHPAMKSTVSAPWPNFQLCPSSRQILATPLVGWNANSSAEQCAPCDGTSCTADSCIVKDETGGNDVAQTQISFARFAETERVKLLYCPSRYTAWQNSCVSEQWNKQNCWCVRVTSAPWDGSPGNAGSGKWRIRFEYYIEILRYC